MVLIWEPETYYNLGDVVEYQGHKYQIIQAHQSQADWTPPATPALWSRVQEQYSGGAQPEGGYNPGYAQAPQPQAQPGYQGEKQGGGFQYGAQEDKPSWEEPHHQQQPGDVSHEERKTSWHNLDPERKKQLEVGGGLLAGIAAIGAGYFAYKEHEKSEDEKKANVWALQNWLKDAQTRTEAFYKNGPRAPVTWVLNEGKKIPQGALPGGEENGQPLYICRAFHEGGIQVGKASSVFKKGAVIGYAHDEIHLGTYEILLGDRNGVRWVDASGRLNVQALGLRPVEGGREADGTPLYIAQAHHHNAVHPGKISEKLDGAFIPYDGTEKKITNYRVLCYV